MKFVEDVSADSSRPFEVIRIPKHHFDPLRRTDDDFTRFRRRRSEEIPCQLIVARGDRYLDLSSVLSPYQLCQCLKLYEFLFSQCLERHDVNRAKAALERSGKDPEDGD